MNDKSMIHYHSELTGHTFTKEVVILPFYGEYGYYLTSFVRSVQRLRSPRKVVCIRRGEEVLFPTASAFFYDWRDFIPDSQKCGFRDSWPITPRPPLREEDRELINELEKTFPHHELLIIDTPLSSKEVIDITIPIDRMMEPQRRVEIVIAARRRHANGTFGDRGLRNFHRWSEIVEPLGEAGYSFGQIGLSETSYQLPLITTRSWDAPSPTQEAIAMLQHAFLFIGTDTGPSHLAAIVGTPAICFRNPQEALSPNLLEMINRPIYSARQRHFQTIEYGWNDPEAVVAAALLFLSQHHPEIDRLEHPSLQCNR